MSIIFKQECASCIDTPLINKTTMYVDNCDGKVKIKDNNWCVSDVACCNSVTEIVNDKICPSFWNWCDWDLHITSSCVDGNYWRAWMCAKEWNLCNLTIDAWVCVYFCWDWTPTIFVQNCFCNLWTIDTYWARNCASSSYVLPYWIIETKSQYQHTAECLNPWAWEDWIINWGNWWNGWRCSTAVNWWNWFYWTWWYWQNWSCCFYWWNWWRWRIWGNGWVWERWWWSWWCAITSQYWLLIAACNYYNNCIKSCWNKSWCTACWRFNAYDSQHYELLLPWSDWWCVVIAYHCSDCLWDYNMYWWWWGLFADRWKDWHLTLINI